MKVICWNCWNYSNVKSQIDSVCKNCGSTNIVPIEEDILFERGPSDIVELFGVQSKWLFVNLIEISNFKILVYEAFWKNPILREEYGDVFFIVKFDIYKPSNYGYGIIFNKENKFFECFSKCKYEHIQKPVTKMITKEMFKKLTIRKKEQS